MRYFTTMIAILTLAALSAPAEAQAPGFRRKDEIELPLKKLIAIDKEPVAPAEPPAAPVGDFIKRKVIELPVENLVAAETSPEADPATADNPRVEPGKVRWHDDFASACEAGKQSGKPVLLFHLMGQLDQKFT